MSLLGRDSTTDEIDIHDLIEGAKRIAAPFEEQEHKVASHYYNVSSYNNLLPDANVVTTPPPEIDDAILEIRHKKDVALRQYFSRHEGALRSQANTLVDDVAVASGKAAAANENLRRFQRSWAQFAAMSRVGAPADGYSLALPNLSEAEVDNWLISAKRLIARAMTTSAAAPSPKPKPYDLASIR